MPNPTLINKKAREFFKKVGEQFPNYDFSEFIYSGCRKKSIVICKKHGGFSIHANSIFQNKTNNLCPECTKEERRLTPEQFLLQAKLTHPEKKYKYNKASVIKASWNDLILIKCKKHGWFKQQKGVHLNGSGCQKCYAECRGEKAKSGIIDFYELTEVKRADEFIQKAISKFGLRYDYSEVLYVNSHTKIIINCPDHGKFEQTPFGHLQSYTGCIHCSKESVGFNYVEIYSKTPSGKEIGTFYKLLFTHKKSNIKFIKIGITKNTIEERFKKYNEFNFDIIDQVQDTNLNCAILEQTYKIENSHNRFFIPDSWKFVGHTECYNYNEEQQLINSAISDLRESLLKKQNGKCAICGNIPKRPVLDHDHKKKVKGTSYCRGVLCSNCNVFLAKLENNAVRFGFTQANLPEIINKMAEYKEADQTLFIHPSEKPKPKRLKKTSVKKLMCLFHVNYPNRKVPSCFTYNAQDEKKGKKLSKTLEKFYEEFKLKPSFLKSKG